MALNVFQEQIPFTNQRVTNAVSSGNYYNPIVMPLSFDVVNYRNFIETVFYIRNDSPITYYNDVLVSLVTINSGVASNVASSLTAPNGTPADTIMFNFDGNTYKVSSSSEVIDAAMNITSLSFPSTYSFVSPDNANNASDIRVKFSYGYDELSESAWEAQNEMLYIPAIGNLNTPDTSYIPIRMRIELLGNNPLYTIRNYSLDVSYGFSS